MYASQGYIKEMVLMIRKMLDNVIDDSGLYNSVECPADSLINSHHTVIKFAAAVLLLYSGDAEGALGLINDVIKTYKSKDTYYIQSRCLACLGRFKDADTANVEMINKRDIVLDAKALFNLSVINERIGDSCLEYMQTLIRTRKKYDNGIVAMRSMMKKQNVKLTVPAGEESSDIENAFNSSMKADVFKVLLRKTRKTQPKEAARLVSHILKMDLKAK